MEAQTVLSARQVVKIFGGVQVVRGVDLELNKAEIHALIGENGAGKSTVIKMLAGVHQPDGGNLKFEGEVVKLPNPRAAHRLGIFTVHQEPALMPQLSVAENVFMGFHPYRKIGFKIVDKKQMFTKAEELFEDLGIPMNVRQAAVSLTIAQQQMVEIAKALVHKVRVLILDEPTATLTTHETELLFSIVRRFRDNGTAVLFVSHRLEEIFALCSKVTVMRDGSKVGTFSTTELDERRLVSLMVGREVDMSRQRTEPIVRQKPLLSVTGLTKSPWFMDVSFHLHPGEILGLAGLVGSGRTNVAEAIFGIQPADRGEIRLDGNLLDIRKPSQAIKQGIVYVPEDRHKHGVILPMGIASNITLPRLPSVSKLGLLDRKSESQTAEEIKKSLSIRSENVHQAVSQLSGGNQQKVVFAKWVSLNPKVVILDEPTRGVDIGAKNEIYRIIYQLAEQGVGVLLISSDLPEILCLSDRVIVMREGKICAEVSHNELSEEVIMHHATGVKQQTEILR